MHPDNGRARFSRVTKGTWKLSVAACLWQAFRGMNRALQARLRDTMPSTAFPQKICAATDSFLKPLSHAPKRDALKNEPPPLREAISVY